MQTVTLNKSQMFTFNGKSGQLKQMIKALKESKAFVIFDDSIVGKVTAVHKGSGVELFKATRKTEKRQPWTISYHMDLFEA